MRRRGRNRCPRWVGNMPPATYYKPMNMPEEDAIVLLVEEFEAIRLVDYLGLSQMEAAVHMGVSQKTLWNDLSSARKKLSDALVNGKPIKIEGGAYRLRKL